RGGGAIVDHRPADVERIARSQRMAVGVDAGAGRDVELVRPARGGVGRQVLSGSGAGSEGDGEEDEGNENEKKTRPRPGVARLGSPRRGTAVRKRAPPCHESIVGHRSRAVKLIERSQRVHIASLLSKSAAESAPLRKRALPFQTSRASETLSVSRR